MVSPPLASRLSSGVFLLGGVYDDDAAPRWQGWLSEEEHDRWRGFGSDRRRCAFLAGRAVARRLLASRMGLVPADVPLRRAEDEAVDVVGTDWHVSIAHSGDRALAAAARHRVGSDLERVISRDPAVARFLLRPDERDLLEALPYDRNRTLLLLWTLKESVLKARRTGFRTSPKAVHLSVDAAAHTARARVQGEEHWAVFFAPWDRYWTAVAVPGERRGTRL
ncbi:MAG: 4'-phosphopantetheinyl transferase superfamily protein [Salinibacter sp.]